MENVFKYFFEHGQNFLCCLHINRLSLSLYKKVFLMAIRKPDEKLDRVYIPLILWKQTGIVTYLYHYGEVKWRLCLIKFQSQPTNYDKSGPIRKLQQFKDSHFV